MILLDGKNYSKKLKNELREEVDQLIEKVGIAPGLAIVLVAASSNLEGKWFVAGAFLTIGFFLLVDWGGDEKGYMFFASIIKYLASPKLLKKGATKNSIDDVLPYVDIEEGAYIKYRAGYYAKVIESQGKIIHLRHEHGLFLTSGNNKCKSKWDLEYYDNFIPICSARSYQLTSSGKDTLRYDCMYGSPDMDRNYVAENTCLFNIMRAIYLYAPLMDDPRHFEFHFVDIDSSDYMLGFVSRQEYWPQKNRMFSKGTLKIDRESLRMKSIEFESMDLQYFLLVNMTSRNPVQSPCLIKAKAEFRYDPEGHAYISQCYSEIIWKKIENEDKRVWSGFNPSRPHPSRNQLVEKEYWACEKYKPVPENLRTKPIAIQSNYASGASAPYDSVYFSDHPNPFATRENIQVLEQYMPLEQQYKNNSNRYYTDYDYRIPKAKKILFDLFLKQ